MIDFSNDPHRRYNILTGEWVLVSPHRTKRPWQGKIEKPPLDNRPKYDEKCYLCPSNIRAGGHTNPNYEGTFVFQNDFAALIPQKETNIYKKGLLHAQGEQGICKVLCFSPDHSLTLPEMEEKNIVKVIEMWREQYIELGRLPSINHVQIFENKGAMMGCSNPHPHGQIWAQSSIPEVTAKKSLHQKDYFKTNKKSLLEEYLSQEIEDGDRIILENHHFVALVPFWAVWPYECMIIPKRHMQHIGLLNSEEKNAFASILKKLTIRLDNIFECSFPYSSGIHQAPTDGKKHNYWHWHMSFYPPLLRSATVKKFMVGYEMFANPQRDISAEQAAEKIRSASDIHYKNSPN